MGTSGPISDADLLVRLSYIDKLVLAYEHVEDSLGRFFRLQVLVSLFVLFLATGVVSADENLEISGLRLSLPLWTLIGGGAIATGAIAATALLQNHHGFRLEHEIYRRYHDLGYDDPGDNDREGLPLTWAVVSASGAVLKSDTTPGWRGRLVDVAHLVLSGLWFCLPVGAQIAAMVRLVNDFGWTWKVLVPIGTTIIATTATVVWSYTTEPPA
jgi:hypothetical protein